MIQLCGTTFQLGPCRPGVMDDVEERTFRIAKPHYPRRYANATQDAPACNRKAVSFIDQKSIAKETGHLLQRLLLPRHRLMF